MSEVTTHEPSYEPAISDFQIVASDSVPTVSIDKQRRFYINTSARRLMSVKPYRRLAVGYNPSSRELAIINVSVGADPFEAATLATSNYNVDQRYYMSARHFVKEYGYDPEGAPYLFDYVAGRSDGSLFVFKLRE